jgi:hypothetical protein
MGEFVGQKVYSQRASYFSRNAGQKRIYVGQKIFFSYLNKFNDLTDDPEQNKASNVALVKFLQGFGF